MSKSRVRLQRWTPWIGALVSAVLVSIAALQFLQWQRFEATLSQGRIGVQWDIFQFQAEHYKLAAKFNETQLLKGRDSSMEELVLRYQVFLSRFDMLRSGVGPREAFLAPENRALFDVVSAFVASADPYLGAEDSVPPYNEEKIAQLRVALEAATPEFQQLVTNVNAIYNEFTTRDMRALRQQALASGGTSFVLALLAVMFGLYALRQQKIAQEKAQRLEAMHQALEEALARAELANRSKADFLANMSHEIRTPMNAVLGMLQLLGHTDLKANQQDYVSKSQGAARSLLGLLDDVLDFSKIDAGKLEIENLPFSLSQLLDDLSVVLSASVGNKPIEVLYDIAADVPDALVGDRLRLQQVLINLAGNAIKFTAQGQVVIALRCQTDAAHPDAPRLHFAVQDSGIGIAPENQSRIFVNFNQAESSTTRRFGGTGLGLAISKRLVEMMGGAIELHSAPGQGSTFSFALPLHHSAERPAAAVAESPLAIEPVLLLDNNPVARDVLARMLSQLGFAPRVATSVDAALALLRPASAAPAEALSAPGPAGLAQPVRYALIDWQMPGVDGWQAVQRITEHCQAQGLPVPALVMMSSSGRDDLAQRTVQEQNSIHTLLLKPFCPNRLRQVLQQPVAVAGGVRRVSRASKRLLAGLRILLVEDNAMNQQVAEELLGAQGASVAIASDGRQGVNAVASATEPFDLVLMDVQMPVMDGYAATREIRQTLRLGALPIIGLTANAMASDRDACLAAGMNEHVGKPFDMGQLVSLIIRLTGHQPGVMASGTRSDAMGPAPSTQEMLAGLSNADIDLPTALGRMGGLQSLYVRAATDFRSLLASLEADLVAAFEGLEPQAFATLVHTNKGNAGTLGLQRLSAELARVEFAFKDPERLREAGQLLAQLPPVITAARTALDLAIQALRPPEAARPASGHAPAGRAADPQSPVPVGTAQAVVSDAAGAQAADARQAQARAHLAQLARLLADHDMAALECFALVRDSLGALPGLPLDALEQSMQALDFETAGRICRR